MSMRKVWEKTYSDYSGVQTELSLTIQGPPEQLAPAALVSQLVAIIVEKVYANDTDIVRMEVWADWSPTLYTKYVVKMRLIPASTYEAQAAGIQWAIPVSAIVALIASAITAIGLALLAYNVKEITEGLNIPGWVWVAAGGLALVAVLRTTTARRAIKSAGSKVKEKAGG